MKAFISGEIGLAAIVNGLEADIYRRSNEKPQKISVEEAKRIFSTSSDYFTLENTTKNAALQRLNFESDKSTALMFILTILDKDIESEEKSPLIDYLDGMFKKNKKVYDYLCNVMFTRELPTKSITSLEDIQCPQSGSVYALLKQLFLSQKLISDSTGIFQTLCMEYNISDKQKTVIEGTLTNASFFYLFGTQQANSQFLASVQFALISLLKSIELDGYVAFSSTFRDRYLPLCTQTAPIKQQSYIDEDEHVYAKTSSKPKREKSKRVNSQKEFQKVKAQIIRIKDALKLDKIASAEALAKELIDYQVNEKHNDLAAQSLCQLSEYAKKLALFDLQLKWSLQATKLCPEDYRSFGHAADAYLNLEDIDNSAIFFKICTQTTGKDRTYGLTGLARIERSRTNYERALEHVNDAINDAPNDYVAYLIKAELLRDKQQYNEAIDIYDYVCLEHPELTIPPCGRAATLADQKKYDEAEIAYRDVLSNYQNPKEQLIANSGLGFLLARMGRFNESHKHLDKCIFEHNYEDSIPVISKARAYIMEGKNKLAESELIRLAQGKRQESDAIEQLMELYLTSGDINKAQKLYDNSSNKIKATNVMQVRYSQLLRCKNKYKEALQTMDKLRNKNPRFILGLMERAAIFKAKRQFKPAQQQYREILEINGYNRKASLGLQAINHILGNHVSSDELMDDIAVSQPKTIEDYIHIGNIGLLKLAQGKTKEGKKDILRAYNSEFGSLKTKFGSSLSLASLKLKQVKAALKPVKRPRNVLDLIQKSMILGENGNILKLQESLSGIRKSAPSYAKSVVSMVENKYITKDAPIASNDEIYNAQIVNLLIAA